MFEPVVIVGGGVGGAATALLLARQGIDVLVIEKDKFPRNKVCGEYISGECLPILQQMGVMDALNERPFNWLKHVTFHSPSGGEAKFELPKQSRAFSIRRWDFDEALTGLAIEAGADILFETRVLDHDQTDDGIRLTLSNGKEMTTAFVIAGDGIRSRFLERKSAGKGQRLFGLKAYFESGELGQDQFEMFFNCAGYGGYSHVEEGTVNCAYIVPESLVKELRGDHEQIYQQGLLCHPTAAKKWGGVKRISDWYATGPIQYGLQTDVPDRVIPVGDSLVTTEQFAGEGIGMAIKSAVLLSRSIQSCGLQDWKSARELYLRRHHETFAIKIGLLNLLRTAMSIRMGAEAIIRTLGVMPDLFQLFYDFTRADYRGFEDP